MSTLIDTLPWMPVSRRPDTDRNSGNGQRPPIAILGVPFDNVTTPQTISLIEGMVASGKPHYLATANVDFVVQAMHDVELRRILMDAHLVVCDGMPLVWASKFLGNPLQERVAGSDLVPLLLQVAEQKGYRVFFLGGEEKVAQQALDNIKAKLPNLQIAGAYSPPFKPLLEMDHEGICERIREAKADLLFVSFGCPKQEKWISMNYRNLGVPVSIGVGATIDFLAGNMKRAPRWMQMSGTEWIYRLLQEPRRLFKRYFVDLQHFGAGICKQLWVMSGLRSRAKKAIMGTPAPAVCNVVKAPTSLDAATIQVEGNSWGPLLNHPASLVLDMSELTFIDSTGVGYLVTLQKALRQKGQKLILASTTRALTRVLKLMRLDGMFLTAVDVEAGLKDLHGEKTQAPKVQLETVLVDDSSQLFWENELTAANLEPYWTSMEAAISQALQAQHKELTVDLAGLRFLDSSGVGLMVRARKKCRETGLSLQFTNPSPNVRSVIRMLKMEPILLGA